MGILRRDITQVRERLDALRMRALSLGDDAAYDVLEAAMAQFEDLKDLEA